ncbi:hypothetical protein L3Y34_012019 [Caenorhabditis briggsae]|uniref:Uncharacterized protein n=1 Tax=Caenorhabditis briggsae TaxID=6238 RepID=A0AAE8ZRC2_CAEBR|nr:hypothetical protein L3Y34_012019 [Caenorhabditis briggsae]
MTSPPSSPSHLHVRKLSTTNEDEAKTTTACPRKPGRKLVALSGEEDIMSGGPPPVQQPKRFRNGHASFRLRMLQEQHGPAGGPPAAQSGSGFEPRISPDRRHQQLTKFKSSFVCDRIALVQL